MPEKQEPSSMSQSTHSEAKESVKNDPQMQDSGIDVPRNETAKRPLPTPMTGDPFSFGITEEEKLLIDRIAELKRQHELIRMKRKIWDPIVDDCFDSMQMDEAPRKNIIIISNRLRVTLTRMVSGRWRFIPSSGGLVSAMRGVKNMNLHWIGWPGCIVAPKDQDYVRAELRKIRCIPVFLSSDIINKYYNGFSNNVLWPLFHFIPLDTEQIKMSEEDWEAYREANKLFMEAVLEFGPKKEDVIWVHDYQLMLLPGMLRQRLPTAQIGFFLHIPFPNAEFFKVLPQRSELLRGLLASNLIGFHIYDYALRFKNSCIRILNGCEETPQCVNDNGRMTAVGTHPIGIDPLCWFEAIENNYTVKQNILSLKSNYKNKRIVLGVDRMDYVKGLNHKLYAWKLFLQNCPEWVGKVVLIQIAVPSRKGIRKYRELAQKIHSMVGSINGQFNTVDYVPIRFLDQTIDFVELAALYHVADACLITSICDGMNLVAYEYVAAQGRQDIERPGVLILSEFTGAAQSLGAGAIRINPWDVKKVAEKIKYALEMQNVERKVYHRYALKYVVSHTAERWANAFIERLKEAHERIGVAPIVPKKFEEGPVLKAWTTSKHRLIILGLVGTITQVRPRDMSYQHFIKFAQVFEESKKAIKKMSQDDRTQIVVVTNRGRIYVEELIGNIGCSICAENGYFYKKEGKRSWEAAYGREGTDDLSWMIETESVMRYFMVRTPNSFIRRSEGSIAFEYHDSDPVHGDEQARVLMETLKKGALSNTATEMVNSMRTVHVRLAGVRKVDVVKRLISELEQTHGFPPDFVFLAGDLLKDDEALFQTINNSTSQTAREFKKKRKKLSKSSSTIFTESPVECNHFPEPHTWEETLLPPQTNVYTCCIPRKASYAQRYLDSPDELNAFLMKLAENLPEDDDSDESTMSEDTEVPRQMNEAIGLSRSLGLTLSRGEDIDEALAKSDGMPLSPPDRSKEEQEKYLKYENKEKSKLSLDETAGGSMPVKNTCVPAGKSIDICV